MENIYNRFPQQYFSSSSSQGRGTKQLSLSLGDYDFHSFHVVPQTFLDTAQEFKQCNVRDLFKIKHVNCLGHVCVGQMRRSRISRVIFKCCLNLISRLFIVETERISPLLSDKI